MHKHIFRQEPRHEVIGQPNEKFPGVERMCGHVDREALMVCILEEFEHKSPDSLRTAVDLTVAAALKGNRST